MKTIVLARVLKKKEQDDREQQLLEKKSALKLFLTNG
jgi:hypothetical protein